MVCPELLSECLRDSPKFRTQLAEQESQIEQLETKVEKMLKLCHQMVDAGQTYVSHQSLFANAVWELAGCFKQEPDVTSALKRLVHALQEMNKYHTILLDQASRTIINNLTAFVKGDVQGVWDSQHHFNKISGELDMALNRHAQISKAKPAELKEAQCLLEANTTCFRHTVLDHVHCVSMLQAKKKPEILGTFVSYLHACSTYFHQGSDLCEGLSPFLKQLNNEVGKLRDEASKLEKKLGNRHHLVAKNELADEDEPMQGYLFKRTSNAFKSWHRRWFCLRDHKLIYRKRSGDDETVMEEDLKLCSVKPLLDFDRRFCFEVMSPTRSHILQADSEDIFNKWVEALQEGIGAALQQGMEVNHNSETKDHNANGTPSSSGRNVRICEQLQKVPGNDVCCDCSTLKPTWASINLGVTLCIECSGIHRSLGVHNSKVRSLTLDSWEPEVLKVMLELGNSVVNKVYEANLPQSFQRLPQSALRSEREDFIKRKWIDREFVAGLVVRGGSPGSVNASRRRWSVRKLRRRGRSKDGKKSSLTPTASLDTTSDTMTISDDTSSIKTDNRASIVVVGDEESLPPSPGVDISSDEDSTSGAEETTSTVGEEMCKLNPTVLLYKASAAHNLPVMCRALALNADKQWTHPEQNNMGHLHQAIRSGSVMACEYLVLNGLSMNTQDDLGRTPLYLAVHLGHTSQVCLLLKHKADQHIKDIGGKDPLDIAIDAAHADIVTLLRLGRLNEEMKESETGDETFNDVVRDFSQMGNSPTKKSPSDSSTSDSKQPDKT